MRYSLICASLAVAALAADAGSTVNAAPWCANFTFGGGGMTCGYQTMDQCRAAISGVGGSCMRNPADLARETQTPAARPRAVAREPVERPQPQIRQTTKRPERVRERERPAPDTARVEPIPSNAVGSPPRPRDFEPPPVVDAPPETPANRSAGARAAAAQPQPELSRALTPPAGRTVTLDVQASDRFFAARDLILSGSYQSGLAAMQALDQGNSADVAAYIGYAHNKLGRTSEARTWYEKALALDPNHLPALAYSGMYRAEQGDLTNAQSYLDKIRTICGGTGCYEYAALQAVIASRKP